MKKTVLVTGAAGFIGSHLVERLAREPNTRVRAFIHYNSKNSWGWLESSPVAKEIDVIAGDIRDYDSVRRAADGCDAIFHLAALIGIPYSYVSPAAYIRVNIDGTYNILQAAREVACPQVLVTSTSETYGTAQTHAISETHPQVAQSPYAATKVASDQLALSFYRSFDLPVKIVRPFNTFGPRQSARAIIPTAITQILSGNRVISTGNLTPTRDLTYVLDTVEGFLAIANSPAALGQVTNIGRNEEISVEHLLQLIAKIMDVSIDWQVATERVRADKSEVFRLRCDNTKILSTTTWRPQFSLPEALALTIDWFRQHHVTYKAGIYNV